MEKLTSVGLGLTVTTEPRGFSSEITAYAYETIANKKISVGIAEATAAASLSHLSSHSIRWDACLGRRRTVDLAAGNFSPQLGFTEREYVWITARSLRLVCFVGLRSGNSCIEYPTKLD